jgi:hypothetical protein
MMRGQHIRSCMSVDDLLSFSFRRQGSELRAQHMEDERMLTLNIYCRLQ